MADKPDHQTPFMAFWAAINAELLIDGIEITYGPAKSLWAQALHQAACRSQHIGSGSDVELLRRLNPHSRTHQPQRETR